MSTPAGVGMQTEALILRRAATVRHAPLAAAIGRDETTISRILASETGLRVRDLEAFLNALGLKVVAADAVIVDEDDLRFFRKAARAYIDRGG